MKIAARLLLAAVLLTSLPVFAQAAAPETKDQKIRRLLVLMKVDGIAVQMLEAMLGSFRETMPEVPEEVWTSFMSKVKGAELIDLLIPVYSRNLQESDIDALITFYSSPAGQNFIAKQSTIMQESMDVGQAWGEKIGKQVEEELRQKKQQ